MYFTPTNTFDKHDCVCHLFARLFVCSFVRLFVRVLVCLYDRCGRTADFPENELIGAFARSHNHRRYGPHPWVPRGNFLLERPSPFPVAALCWKPRG